MKTKIFFIVVLLFAVVHLIQAQIRGQIQFNKESIITVKDNGFDRIINNENSFIEDPGSPALPVLFKSYLIPVDADKVTVNVQNVSKQKIEGQYTIFPAQPPIPVGNTDSKFVGPNSQIYESKKPYPDKQAEIISDEFYLGYRIITVHLYPVEYIPQTKELYVCSFSFSIDYSMPAKRANGNEFRMQTQSLYRYELNKKAVKFRVENPDAVDNYDTKVQRIKQGKTVVYDFSASPNEKGGTLRSQSVSVLDEQTPDYIIITCDSLRSAFQPLADWKTKKGIFTVIKTTEDINIGYSGSDMQEKIRNYIIESKNKWGNGLYVLLGGGVNVIPARMVNGDFVSQETNHQIQYPTDMYYATYVNSWNANGNSKFNEYEYKTNASGYLTSNPINLDSANYSLGVILGRIPVENVKETAIWVNKVLTYERANAFGDLYYLRNNLYADAYISDKGGYLSDFAIKTIRDYTNSYVPSPLIDNKFICDNALCEGNKNWYTPSGSNCNPLTGQCTVQYNGDIECNGDIEFNHDNFLSCLNTGADLGIGKFHFIYHMDHGNPFSISTSGKGKGQNINRTDMDNLSNGPSWQIFMSGACHSANFQYDCFAKHYLMNPNGGGISYIGNTDIGWSSEYMQLQYFLDALYITTSHPTNLKRYDIGSVFQNIIKKGYSSDWRLHLLGDPEMQVWTDVPQTLNVMVTPVITQAGQRSVNVKISNLSLPTGETALICLQAGTEVYETLIAPTNNTYTIPVEVETPGTMNYVTVTAHNYFPVEDSIQIMPSEIANPIISSLNFIDDGSNSSNGNGNGQNDAGETICLKVTLKNNGVKIANNLTAMLSSPFSVIDVWNSSTILGSILPYDTADAQFLYNINKDCPEVSSNDSLSIQLKLNIKDAFNNTWTKTFNIDVFATDLQQRNKIIANSTSSGFDMQIELQNLGKAPAAGITGLLNYNNNSIPISFPDTIHYKETKLSTVVHIPVSLVSNPVFTLNVTNPYGKIWNFSNFNLTKPDTVTKLQSFSKVREIDLNWKTPVSGASGYNIYRCNVDSVTGNESGGYVRLNVTPVTFTFYNDADSLKPLTKYFYKVHAVSQSGMESDSVRLLAWTSYSTTGLYPVVMDALKGTLIESNFVTEDVNNDGKKEIFTSVAGSDGQGIGDLVALDWEGNELFNIDNNVTTYSGFANLQTSIRAGVAIGDINQDGINEIVSVSRSREAGNVNNKITCHIAYDNNRDHMPDTLWQVPLLRGYISAAILDNMDNSPDGSMEILTVPDANTDSIFRAPQIYNSQGKLIQELSINGGTVPISGGDNTYASAAVADLDGDGDKEIIAGYTDGVYVWHHNGNPFGAKNPFFTLPCYCFDSSPVVCDINNDDKKEILISAFLTNNPTSCRILAIDTTGAMLPGWDTTSLYNKYTSTANYSWATGLTKEISVGNLENNDSLEVVAVVATGINIWNNDGTLYDTIPVPGLESQARYPLLADIDGDNEAEIIVTSVTEGKIYGYKRSGAQVLGFPLQTDNTFGNATPVIADLDGDGKSEIAAGTAGDNKIYVWKTNGNPNRIEWGSARHDARNTGEYWKICPPTQILSNTAWNSIMDICDNLIIEPGATLTLNSACTLNMNSSSMLIIRPGANLVIDGGKVLNANIKAMPQSSVTIKNNGYVKLRKNGEFNILLGATLDYQLGSIDITQ